MDTETKEKSSSKWKIIVVALLIVAGATAFIIFYSPSDTGQGRLSLNLGDDKAQYQECINACMKEEGKEYEKKCSIICSEDSTAYPSEDTSNDDTDVFVPITRGDFEEEPEAPEAPEAPSLTSGYSEPLEEPLGPDEEVVAKVWVNLSPSYGDKMQVGFPKRFLGSFMISADSNEDVTVSNLKFTLYRDEDGTSFNSVDNRNQNSGVEDIFGTMYLYKTGGTGVPIRVTDLTVENDRVVANFQSIYTLVQANTGAVSFDVYADVNDDAPIGNDLDGVALVIKSVNDIDLHGNTTDYTGIRFHEAQEDSQNINGTYYQYVDN